ncbi:MAG: MoxR family ATPase, partial [Myxococcales bacterium]|nr:MoxR family ATPase [Myxococcales bacterium]
LPEAQLDRFLFQIDVTYPPEEDEVEIVRRTTAPEGPAPEPVLSREAILEMQALIPRVPCADHVVRYAVRLARASRPGAEHAPDEVEKFVSFGAGPRASQALILAAKCRAVIEGRFAAESDDVRAVAHPVLRHRLVTNYRAEAENIRADRVIDALLAAVPLQQ